MHEKKKKKKKSQFILLKIPPHLVIILGKIHALSIEVLTVFCHKGDVLTRMGPFLGCITYLLPLWFVPEYVTSK